MLHIVYMAATPQQIIDAIDDAILVWADQPVSISISGRSKTYRTLNELLEARRHYVNMLRTGSGSVAFQMHRIELGGCR